MSLCISFGYSTATLLAQLLRGQGATSKAGAAVDSQASAEDSRLQNLFAAINNDGDCKVSAAEFTSFSDRFSASASSTLLEAQAGGTDSSEIFASLDINGDGSLDQSEFEAGMPPPPSPSPGGGGEAFAGDVFASLNADGNGSIDAGELQAALSRATSTEDSEGAAAALLSELDVDGDGSISESELKTAIAAMTPPPLLPPAEETAATEGAAKTGSTGATAAAEEESYDPLDTNEDGFVSMAERLAGMRSGVAGLSGGLSEGTMSALLQSVAGA